MFSDPVLTIAQQILSRAQHQNWRGKAGNNRAIECACGAVATSIALLGHNHPTTNAISFFAVMVSTRGLAYVKERANKPAA